ncbi:uncharacterized protein MYCGRDRAFT_87695 [Zymoseptoria tritici IPO323]|uniref:Mandelate racemase/muconate lactonizing enzyme C-terminal domain-containing protein n=1 Tax=Zymoseptoria tritici (strain CBS 115943 / IPO323) TaxID=336722 RepID=F9XL82_ZYMTI|nr:uncharacterized protein MYCGRDRAFT_87695 [Zymoseptoria tritici IPO323]EGP84182.1 hypothetical protein MYCGRDRAFT_87695 [Zymoseptoria tritici IPO323]
MLITSIEYFRLPPRWLFVKIIDSSGNTGWGEASLEGHTEAVEGCLDAFRTRFLGLEADDIEHIWQLGYRGGFYRGGPLLGGKVRTELKVYAWIGGDRPGDVEVMAKGRVEQGFKAVKMNATEDLGWLDSPGKLDAAVERVRTVKGLGLDVGVDFHGRVHKPMAKQLAKLLEAERVMFIEEPLLSENVEGIQELARLVSTPIALGERLHSRWDVKPFLEGRCVDVLQPDICHCGGISETLRIARMAEAYDVALAPHCPLGPIAMAASLQVDAVCSNFAIQEMPLGIHYNVGGADLLSYTKNPEIWDVKDGMIKLPSGPGLGIEIDEEAVRAASIDTEAWRSPIFYGPGGEIREW